MPNCYNCNSKVPKIIYANIQNPPVCSCCGVQYPEKSIQEATLSIQQDKYLSTRSPQELRKLESLLDPMIHNVIKYYTKKYHFYIDEDEHEDIFSWAYVKMHDFYTTKPDFKVDASFNRYLSLLMLTPFFGERHNKKNHKEISLDKTLSYYDDEGKTLLDLCLDKKGDDINIDTVNILKNTVDEFSKNHSVTEILITLRVFYMITREKMLRKKLLKYGKSFSISSVNLNNCYNEFEDIFKKKSSSYVTYKNGNEDEFSLFEEEDEEESEEKSIFEELGIDENILNGKINVDE